MTPTEIAEAMRAASADTEPLRERIAELESAIRAALRHADGNGMNGWPVFKALRMALER